MVVSRMSGRYSLRHSGGLVLPGNVEERLSRLERRIDRLEAARTQSRRYGSAEEPLPVLGMFASWSEARQFIRWYLAVVVIATGISMPLGRLIF